MSTLSLSVWNLCGITTSVCLLRIDFSFTSLVCRSITESQTCKTSLYNNSIWIFLPFPGIKISPKCLSHFHTLSSLACSQLRRQCVVVIKTNKRNYLGRLNVWILWHLHNFPFTQLTFQVFIFLFCFSFFFAFFPLPKSVENKCFSLLELVTHQAISSQGLHDDFRSS